MSLLQRHVELYEFTRGARVMRLTDGDRLVIHDSQEYAPAPGLKRGPISQSATEARSELGLEVPRSFPLLNWLTPQSPTARIGVKLRRVRVSDGASRVLWSGRLGDVKEGTRNVSLRCQTLLASMGTNGLRRCWQVACPLVLGGPECGVDMEAFRVDADLGDSHGYVVHSPAFDAFEDGWFDGGYLRWTDGTDVEYRFVLSHVGTALTLLTPLPAGGVMPVPVYPGCAHSMTVCNGKFGNGLRYGGQHTMPKGKQPFDGNAVF